MPIARFFLSISLLALLCTLSSNVVAQGPPMPKPGPEHELFKTDEGTWDAVVETVRSPGSAPVTSKGVEVNTIGCGGLCLITDFKGELMPGLAFQGHGVMTWDSVQKKYRGSWMDSVSQGLAITEGTWDGAARRFNGWMEGPDMDGNVVKARSTVEYRPDGTRVMTAYNPGPDGKEMQILRISYTRRK